MIAASNANIRSIRYLKISTIDEAKHVFDTISLSERQWRQSVAFDKILESPRSRLGIGEHDRVESYVFGNGKYPIEDEISHKRYFPVALKTVEIDEVFLPPNEELDLSAKHQEFPWEINTTELYLFLKINRLILSANSKLLVSGNVTVLNCDHVISNLAENEHASIILRSIPHKQSCHGVKIGRRGKDGKSGAPGKSLKRLSTLFGVSISKGSAENEGRSGENGSDGEQGIRGSNGSMLYLADLRFKKVSGFRRDSIIIEAAASNGEPGSAGGNGGNGGNGGIGANGAHTPFGLAFGMSGGSGGNGGNGGAGGNGGNGGLSSPLFLSIPTSCSNIFKIESTMSQGGEGGIGGKGGEPGKPGENGKYFEFNTNHITLNGKQGLNGKPGKKGKSRPAPKIHIYEH